MVSFAGPICGSNGRSDTVVRHHAVAFKDGNKQNIALDNLELVSRADLMKRNSYHNYGKEIAQLVQLKGAVTRQINKRERNQA